MAKISELNEIQQTQSGYFLLSTNDTGQEWESNKISFEHIISSMKSNFNMAFAMNGGALGAINSSSATEMPIPQLVYYDSDNQNLFYYDANGSRQIIDLNYNPDA